MSSNTNSINALNSASYGSPVGAMPTGGPGFTNQGNIPFSSLESLDSTDFQEKKKHDKFKWIAIAGSVVIGGLTLYVSKGKIAEAWKKMTHKESQPLKDRPNTTPYASKQPDWLKDLTPRTRWKDIQKHADYKKTSKEALYKAIISRYEDDHLKALKALAMKKSAPAPTFEKQLLIDMLNEPRMKPYRQIIAEECLMANLPRDVHKAICAHNKIDVNRVSKIKDPEKPEVEMTLFHRLMEKKSYQAAELVSQQARFNQLIPSDGKDFRALLEDYEHKVPANITSLNRDLEIAKIEHKKCFRNWQRHKTDENFDKVQQAQAVYSALSSEESPERLASLLETIRVN